MKKKVMALSALLVILCCTAWSDVCSGELKCLECLGGGGFTTPGPVGIGAPYQTRHTNTLAELNEALADPNVTQIALLQPATLTAPTTFNKPVFQTYGAVITTNGNTLTINVDDPRNGLWQRFNVAKVSEEVVQEVVFGSGSVSVLYPQWYNGFPAVRFSSDAINSTILAAPAGATVRFVGGVYYVNSQIKCTKSIRLEFDEVSYIDGTRTDKSPIVYLHGSESEPYLLGGCAAAGTTTIDGTNLIAAKITPAAGDLIRITTMHSEKDENGNEHVYGGSGELWDDSRDYYYKGEIVEVDSVSGNSIKLRNALFDSYTGANTVIMKITPIKVTLINPQVLGTDGSTDGSVTGISIKYGRDVRVEGGKVEATRLTGLGLAYCYGAVIDGLRGSDLWYGGTVTSYGINLQSCQYVNISNCHICGGRHAISLGGKEPTRAIRVSGCTLENKHDLPLQALDSHENTEYIEFVDNPYVTGIESAARNATIARNHIVARQSMPLSALLCEISGTSKELKILDNTIISDSKDHEGIAIYPVQGQSAAIHTLYILGNTIRTPNAKDKAALYVTVYAQDRKGFTIDEANIIGNTINTGSANHAAVGVKVNGFPCHCIVVGTFNFRNNTIKCGSGSEALNIFDLCGTTMYIDGNHFEYNSEGGRGLAIEKTTVDYLHVKNNTVINNNDKPGGPMYLYANKFVWFVDNFVKNYYRDILSTNGCDLFYSGNKTDTVSGPPPEAIKVGTIYTQLGANRKTIYKRYATNDPKPIAAIEYALTGDKAYMVEAHVMVTQGANGAAFVRRALIYRDNAGNAALQGICIDEMTVKSPSDTTQCTIGVSNVNKGNIQLLVTGVAADASLEAELEVYSNGE